MKSDRVSFAPINLERAGRVSPCRSVSDRSPRGSRPRQRSYSRRPCEWSQFPFINQRTAQTGVSLSRVPRGPVPVTDGTAEPSNLNEPWLQYWTTVRQTIHGLDEAIQKSETDIYTAIAVIVTVAFALLGVLFQFSTYRVVYYSAPLMAIAIGSSGVFIVYSVSGRVNQLFQVQKNAIKVGVEVERKLLDGDLAEKLGLTIVIDRALPVTVQEAGLRKGRLHYYGLFLSLIGLGVVLLGVFWGLGLLQS